MKLIRPTTLTDAMLTSSTAPENDYAVWSSGTAYAVGARVILTSTHRKYEALAASTGVSPASDPTKWLDLGPTNRWAMFDARVGTATTRTSTLQVVLAPGATDGVPRHDLGEEQVDAFARAGVAAVLWKGRTAPDPVPENPDQRMCLDPDAQADALAAELSVEQAVCKVKRDSKTFYCPHYEVCGYQRQKLIAKSAQVIICAHDSLFHAMPKVIG